MKLKATVLGVVLLAILSGCSDPVQDDLLNYINEEMQPLAVLEEEAIAEYDSVTGNNYVDDMTTYVHIEEVVIPLYRDFIDQLEAVDPKTSEVQELHENYIAAVNLQESAMIKILAAIDQQDYDMVAEANNMLAAGRAGIRSFTNELEILADEHNVEMTE
ncbi:hypothetical protein [Rossellomorea aquimaris]|uniref:hypothetical protein n=1 Tax=Rossellomorea aquimaris TaxID=189382 RepID=UPI001CFEB435|nr:hypothetical protein [Rossellomorea aquimaris]